MDLEAGSILVDTSGGDWSDFKKEWQLEMICEQLVWEVLLQRNKIGVVASGASGSKERFILL